MTGANDPVGQIIEHFKNSEKLRGPICDHFTHPGTGERHENALTVPVPLLRALVSYYEETSVKCDGENHDE